MSGFSGDLIYININCPTPGGLVEIKSRLLLPYNPGILLHACMCYTFPDITAISLYIEEVKFPTLSRTSGLLAESKPQQNPTMSPLCPAGGVVGTDIDRCIREAYLAMKENRLLVYRSKLE